MYTPILFDLHTHSISSGHGSLDTISSMAKEASSRGLCALGIADHGPLTPGSAKQSYFRNLHANVNTRFGIRILYGVELNILNAQGVVDLPEDIIEQLDYAIVSYHPPTCKFMSSEDNTNGYLRAMEHKNIRFLGHIDDGRYPTDYKKILSEAKARNIFPEINNMSLAPNAYRTNGHENTRQILHICKDLQLPVLLSSDSHGKSQIGNIEYILPLLEETSFPKELILNYQSRFLDTI